MDDLPAPTMSDPSPAGFRGLAFVASSTSFLDQLTELRVVPLLRQRAARDRDNAAIFVSSQLHLVSGRALKPLVKAAQHAHLAANRFE